MEETLQILKKVETKLKAKAWFKKDKWLTSVHGFPQAKPEFVTFHVFKKNWFNDDSQGIHIESFLAIDPKKRKNTSVTMHILHHDKIPGTTIKRKALAQPFVDAIFDEVSSWESYSFRAGKYGTQPFTRALDGSGQDFEKELETEITRICRKLGPVMDKTIQQVLGK